MFNSDNPVGRAERYMRLISVLVAVTLLSACSTNNLVVRFLYSRADNNIEKRFYAYADFNREQKAWIRQSTRDFVKWHRQTQLPAYAKALEQIERRLADEAPLDSADMQWLLETLEDFWTDAYRASPFPNSIDMLVTLSDRQVDQIEAQLKEDNEAFIERVSKREPGARADRRVRNFARFFARLDVDLTPRQEQLVRDGFDRYVGDPLARFRVWTDWSGELVAILRTRHEPGFAGRAGRHIEIYRNMMETYRPSDTTFNRRVTLEIVQTLVNDFDREQRENLRRSLRDLAKLFRSMAGDRAGQVVATHDLVGQSSS